MLCLSVWVVAAMVAMTAFSLSTQNGSRQDDDYATRTRATKKKWHRSSSAAGEGNAVRERLEF